MHPPHHLTPGSHFCPAHNDHRSPSLSVAQAADGRWLIHCHAGCDTEAVLEAWGLTWADIFPQPARPRAPSRRSAAAATDPQGGGATLPVPYTFVVPVHNDGRYVGLRFYGPADAVRSAGAARDPDLAAAFQRVAAQEGRAAARRAEWGADMAVSDRVRALRRRADHARRLALSLGASAGAWALLRAASDFERQAEDLGGDG